MFREIIFVSHAKWVFVRHSLKLERQHSQEGLTGGPLQNEMMTPVRLWQDFMDKTSGQITNDYDYKEYSTNDVTDDQKTKQQSKQNKEIKKNHAITRFKLVRPVGATTVTPTFLRILRADDLGCGFGARPSFCQECMWPQLEKAMNSPRVGSALVILRHPPRWKPTLPPKNKVRSSRWFG